MDSSFSSLKEDMSCETHTSILQPEQLWHSLVIDQTQRRHWTLHCFPWKGSKDPEKSTPLRKKICRLHVAYRWPHFAFLQFHHSHWCRQSRKGLSEWDVWLDATLRRSASLDGVVKMGFLVWHVIAFGTEDFAKGFKSDVECLGRRSIRMRELYRYCWPWEFCVKNSMSVSHRETKSDDGADKRPRLITRLT